MIDITELAQSMKRRATSSNELGGRLYVKAYDVLALVEALEKAQRANAAQNDHINQQADRIESLEKKNGELGRRLYQYSMEPGEAEQRIAELESRTVKLPATRLWAGVTECYEKSDVIAAIRAAGVEVSDD